MTRGDGMTNRDSNLSGLSVASALVSASAGGLRIAPESCEAFEQVPSKTVGASAAEVRMFFPESVGPHEGALTRALNRLDQLSEGTERSGRPQDSGKAPVVSVERSSSRAADVTGREKRHLSLPAFADSSSAFCAGLFLGGVLMLCGQIVVLCFTTEGVSKL